MNGQSINGLPFPENRERAFWAKVNKASANGCWEWTAGTFRAGYGSFRLTATPSGPGGGYYAHRIAWELLRGPIPSGLHIDHLCLNKRCVNPDHLEVVTLIENVERAMARPEWHVRPKGDVCPNGHPYIPANTYVAPNGKRHCRTCARLKQQRTRRNRKMKEASTDDGSAPGPTSTN